MYTSMFICILHMLNLQHKHTFVSSSLTRNLYNLKFYLKSEIGYYYFLSSSQAFGHHFRGDDETFYRYNGDCC